MRRKYNLIPKLHIKKGDTVKVISGDDKGKSGRVISIYPKKSRVVIEGVNIITKHSKPTATNPEGGRIQKEGSVHISNVLLVDSKGQPVGKTKLADNKQKKNSQRQEENK
jgi:large subunit ribosomal protein L24